MDKGREQNRLKTALSNFAGRYPGFSAQFEFDEERGAFLVAYFITDSLDNDSSFWDSLDKLQDSFDEGKTAAFFSIDGESLNISDNAVKIEASTGISTETFVVDESYKAQTYVVMGCDVSIDNGYYQIDLYPQAA